MDRSLCTRLPFFALVIAAILVGLLASHRDSGDVFATYDPAVDTALCDQFAAPVFVGVPICADGVGAIAANSPESITTIVDTPIGDYLRETMITTAPGAAALNEGPGHPLFGPDGGASEDGAGPATCADLVDNGPDGVADAADPDCMSPGLGDLLGQSLREVNLGLANGICGGPLVLDLKFINSSVATAVDIDPIPQALAGFAGVMENMQSDDGSAATAGIPPDPAIPVNGLPAAVDMYPSFLNAMFDPDFVNYGPDLLPFTADDVNGPAPPVAPLQRLHAGAVPGGISIEINMVTFAPGALAAAFAAPHPYADITAEMGYATVTVIDDPTQPAAPTAITDECTDDFTLTTIWGESHANPCNGVVAPPCDTPGGINDPAVGPITGQDRARTPPAAGTYLYLTYSASSRDADGDGLENTFDTCAELATPGFDPRVVDPANDPEVDMLPGGGPAGGCDPAPAVDVGAGNADGDIAPNGAPVLNALDNCPLVANGPQADAEQTMDVYALFAANPAPQGGPKTDGIGDPCDSDDTKANGDYLVDLRTTAKCIGGVDADDDGYCVAVGAGVAASDPADAVAAVTPEDFDLIIPMAVTHSGAGDMPPERQPVQVCNDGIDNDGDTLIDALDAAVGNSTCRPVSLPAHPGFPACPVLGCTVDADGDGFTGEVERYVGTNALARCGPGALPSPSDSWPIDFMSAGIPNSTDRITITDLTSFLAIPRKFNTSPGDATFNVRWDLIPGPGISADYINIVDLTALTSAAPVGSPPMLSGARAFNQVATCTAHPVFGR